MIQQLLIAAAVGLTSSGKVRVDASLCFTATASPVNAIALELVDDIVIADAESFGVHSHRAYVIDGPTTFLALEDGFHVKTTEVAAR